MLQTREWPRQERKAVPLEVFAVVVMAAIGHAVWNALLRAERNKRRMMRVMFTTQMVAALAILPFVPLPNVESLPYLVASASIGVGAMLLLSHAYGIGDLSQVYPLSRGSAPLFVALISTTLLGEELSWGNFAGIVLIGFGVTSLSLTRGIHSLQNGPLIAVALANGALTALCNLIDGYGARVSGSTHGYVATLAFLLSALMVLTTRITERGAAVPMTARATWLGILAGLMSLTTAWAVIWAMTHAPIPLISALRESSIIFATAIGIFFFREAPTRGRLISIALVVLGVAVLRLGA